MPLPPTLASRLPTKEALQAVRNVIQSQAKPVKTQDLYKQVLKEPNGGSAVRSMRYMKHVLLPTLAGQQVVQQIHVKPTVAADEKAHTMAKMSKSQRQSNSVKTALHGYFGWVVREPQPAPKPKPRKEPFGTVVGVGEDWGHLNRRRRRSRAEKVQRDVEWLKELEAVRRNTTTTSSTL